ncbi:hypothetical protein [Tessaracoccus terricola]
MAPRLLDAVVVRLQPLQRSTGNGSGDDGSLGESHSDRAGARGDGQERRFSTYTWLRLHPRTSSLIGIGALGALAASRLRRRRSR